jgi:hypothetical protein
MVLISGFAVYVVLAPAHPCGLLASQASPVRSARPPPKGAPSDPRAFAFGFCYEFGSCSRTGYFGFWAAHSWVARMLYCPVTPMPTHEKAHPLQVDLFGF